MTNIAGRIGTAIGATLLALGAADTADAASAPPAFTVCTACHMTTPDHATSVGPNLRGVVGRRAGSQSGYAYSPALKSAGIIWTPDKIEQWLAGPSKMIPGVRMVQTIPSLADRKIIVAYLATLK